MGKTEKEPGESQKVRKREYEPGAILPVDFKPWETEPLFGAGLAILDDDEQLCMVPIEHVKAALTIKGP